MSTVLKDKMFNYEVPPPPAVWGTIISALDDSDMGSTYPYALRELSVTPPASSWNKIAELLPVSQPQGIPAPVRRITPWLMYAAAAVILAFLAWGGYTLFSNDNNGTDIATNGDIVKPVIPGNENIPEVITPSAPEREQTIADIERDDAALEQSKTTYAKLTPPNKSKIRNAADFYFTAPEDSYYGPGQTRGLDITETAPVNSIDLSNRYIMLMTPDGHIIRISKKLSDQVCCVAGEEDDVDCTDRMKQLREKIASPSATQSPADFMDILSLLRSL